MEWNIFDHQGGTHTRLPLSFEWLKNFLRFLSKSLNLSSRRKLLDPLCHAYLVPEIHWPKHIIHSDFDFFLSYFVMFVLFLLPCFVCLCVCVLICSFYVSTPPLLCLQLALSVSNHPSDLSPSCMPSPYMPLLWNALQLITIALRLLCLIKMGVPSGLSVANSYVICLDFTTLPKSLTLKIRLASCTRSVC